MSTTTYMCLSVRGAINHLQTTNPKNSGFQDLDGRPMSRTEALDAFMDELVQGHEVIPMNQKCDNPCKNSTGCAGFDYGKGGGCPGHPTMGGAA